MSLFITIVCLLSIPILWYFKILMPLWFVVVLLILFGVTFLLHYLKKPMLARSYHIILFPLVLMTNVLLFGSENSPLFFFFPYLIVTFYFYRKEKIQWFYITYYILAMVFCFGAVDTVEPYYEYPKIGLVNVLVSLGAVFIQIVFLRAFNFEIVSNENRVAQLLESVTVQNSELEHKTNILTLQATELQQAKKQLLSVNEILEGKVNRRTEDLRKTNSELLRSNKDLEEFAYVASHDLQEPLRMVGNFVQLLDEEYSEKIDDEGRSYINYAVDGVKRMSKLIEELLSYSRVGRKEMNLKEIDLNGFVEKKMLDLQQKIKSLNAVVNLGPLPEKLFCEPGQISIVFYNLVANSLKFNNSEHPIIDISSTEKEDHFLFSVKDNGIGIEQKDKHKIFKLFKRLHRKEDYEGTGIGLSLCRKIIIRHDGDIWFESEDGNGTTFYFTIGKNLRNE